MGKKKKKEESESKEENTITAKMENIPELQWSKPDAPVTLMKTRPKYTLILVYSRDIKKFAKKLVMFSNS